MVRQPETHYVALLTYQGNLTHFDVRDILGSVHVPTIVIHRRDEAIPARLFGLIDPEA